MRQLAEYIARTQPGLRGFTRANLFRMRQFYETYRDDEKVVPLVRQLPWSASLGKLPYWSFSIFRTYIRPALKEAKIASKVGWHTFRHSYATILKSHGEDVKTVQELMRHANSAVTLNLYAQAVTDIKRSAQSKVARLIFQSGEQMSDEG